MLLKGWRIYEGVWNRQNGYDGAMHSVSAGPLYDPPMSFLRALRRLSIVEGISTLVLFGIAMPLKYFAGMPMAVRVVGSLHGALFVALVVMLLLAIRKVPLSPVTAALGMVAAVVPGGPFWFDRRLAKLEPR